MKINSRICLLALSCFMVSVLQVSAGVARLSSCKKYGGAFYPFLQNKKISNPSPIKVKTNIPTIEQCIGECIEKDDCETICYQSPNKTCELYKGNITEENSTTEDGWVCMKTKEKEVFAHGCSDMECKNGYCIDTCDEPYAKCICDENYVGKGCQHLWSCRVIYTDYTSSSQTNILDIKYHPLQCAINEVLHAFHLEVNAGDGQWRFKYQCCRLPGTCDMSSKDTQKSTMNGVNFLDRYHIKCDVGSGINSVVPFTGNPGSLENYFNYKCCRNSLEINCYDEVITNPDIVDMSNVTELSNLNVTCKPFYALTSYIFRPTGDGHMYCKIKCCPIFNV